ERAGRDRVRPGGRCPRGPRRDAGPGRRGCPQALRLGGCRQGPRRYPPCQERGQLRHRDRRRRRCRDRPPDFVPLPGRGGRRRGRRRRLHRGQGRRRRRRRRVRQGRRRCPQTRHIGPLPDDPRERRRRSPGRLGALRGPRLPNDPVGGAEGDARPGTAV
ncbi:MAG: hypothetical protein AVDCRST_MAG59-3037, partial [uncultured Thermomicrobiales bacterium]